MVWPAWASDTIIEFVVVENLASIGHLLFALAVSLLGCAARVFWAYASYQLYTTAAKTLAFPEHTLGDWTWDFAGDTMEFLIGMGLAQALGIYGRLQPSGRVEKACSPRGIIVGLSLLTLVWLVFFLRALGGA